MSASYETEWRARFGDEAGLRQTFRMSLGCAKS